MGKGGGASAGVRDLLLPPRSTKGQCSFTMLERKRGVEGEEEEEALTKQKEEEGKVVKGGRGIGVL